MKPGPKPEGKVLIDWSSRFAYAIGLLVADGCLSKDGRHIDFTSKDRVLVQSFRECLNLTTKISPKRSGSGNISYHTQFGDVLFYRFLNGIGITPAKSKTIRSVHIPDPYFIDFLGGYFDGDGSSYSYYDPLYPRSYRFYISFTSASPEYIRWLQGRTTKLFGLKGFVNFSSGKTYAQLKFSKREALTLARLMYSQRTLPRLQRKYLKIRQSVRIIEAHAAVVKLVDTHVSEACGATHGSSSLPRGTI